MKGIATRQRANTESARYKAQRCKGYPLRGSCSKVRERLVTEEDIRHRKRWCIEPEAIFEQMKYNIIYKKLRHVGEDKATMDFVLFAIAFNLKKLYTKLLKTRKGFIIIDKLGLLDRL